MSIENDQGTTQLDGQPVTDPTIGQTGTDEDRVVDAGTDEDRVDDGADEVRVDDTGSDGAGSDDAGEDDGGEDDAGEDVLGAQPDIADDELTGALESVLLVVDSPVTEQALAVAVDRGVAEVHAELVAMADRLRAARSGIDLREIGGGWRFYTRDRFAPVVERFVLDGQQSRLSRAALETLAVIAYRQPVTRARIAGVRGVNVDGVIRTLVARGLIEEVGTDGETGAMQYRTTELFTERLGLNSLEELPEIGPLLPEVDAIDDV